MVRVEDLLEGQRRNAENLLCPTFETQPWVTGPPLSERRVAIISTAGLHIREDHPFTRGAGEFVPGYPQQY